MATENILIKFTSDTSGIKDSITEMQKLGKITEEDAKKFQMMEGITEGIADALKEAGVDASTFNKAIKDSSLNTKTLAAQINEARNNAVQMSRAFGAGSQQAKEAAANVAKLKKEQEDLNKAIFASDPGKRFEVYGKAVQGVQGAFHIRLFFSMYSFVSVSMLCGVFPYLTRYPDLSNFQRPSLHFFSSNLFSAIHFSGFPAQAQRPV